LIATVIRLSKDGKAAERAGESENLPGYSSRRSLRGKDCEGCMRVKSPVFFEEAGDFF